MDERGVSPVVGVLLMVAVTVIVAAVVAQYVFGMAGTVTKPGFASFSVVVTEPTGNKVDVKLTMNGVTGSLNECVVYLDDEATNVKFSSDDVGKTKTVRAKHGQVLTVVCDFYAGMKTTAFMYEVP